MPYPTEARVLQIDPSSRAVLLAAPCCVARAAVDARGLRRLRRERATGCTATPLEQVATARPSESRCGFLTVSVLTTAQLLARPCCVARACRLNGAPGFRRAAPLLPSRASRLYELPRPSRALVCSSLPYIRVLTRLLFTTPRGRCAVLTRRLNAHTCLSFSLDVAPNRSHTSHSSMFPVASKLPCWQAAATTPSPRLTQDTRVRIPFLSRTS